MSEAYEVGKKLVAYCKEEKFWEAMNELYSKDIVSIEPSAMPPMPARIDGLEAVLAKGKWWMENHIIHKTEIFGPYPHGNRFIVRFVMDVTAKIGPMAGQRMTMDEAALYTVRDGKIVHEEFFYAME